MEFPLIKKQASIITLKIRTTQLKWISYYYLYKIKLYHV